MDESKIDYLAVAAKYVWEVAGVGQIVVTDPITGSTTLVGFFVPPWQMNALGRALGDRAILRPTPPPTTLMRVPDNVDEDFVPDMGDNLFLAGCALAFIAVGFVLGLWLG
jgi:hypothetical protein